MSNKRIIALFIGAMVLGMASFSVVVAEDIELDGTLKGKVQAGQAIAIVAPVFNMSLEQQADVNVLEDSGNYSANITLQINVDSEILEEYAGPQFLLTRTRVVFSDRSIFPMFNLGLLSPSVATSQAVHIAGNNFLGLPTEGINITFTMDDLGDSATSENLTIWIWAMGFMPGAPEYPHGQSENSNYEMIAPNLPGYLGLHVVNLKLNYIYP